MDIDYLTAVKDDQELRLEKGSEALRTIKAQNEQVGVSDAVNSRHVCASMRHNAVMQHTNLKSGGLTHAVPSCPHADLHQPMAWFCLQARQKVSSTCASISQMYSFVDQATEATAAQLESTKLALQQHAAKQPAVAEAPLEPGPGQVGTGAGFSLCCTWSVAVLALGPRVLVRRATLAVACTFDST